MTQRERWPQQDSYCPCGSGREIRACCLPFVDHPMLSGTAGALEARGSFRRHLFELLRHSVGLLELQKGFFEALQPFGFVHEALGGDPALRQGFLEHFLFDYFQKYSDARPILRIARALEFRDLRLSNRLDAWSLHASEPWEVVLVEGEEAELRHLGTQRTVRVLRGFEHHEWACGDGLLCRVLEHLGHHFTGLSMLRFEGGFGCRALLEGWRGQLDRHHLKPSVTLRPDVHNEIWLGWHTELLVLWRRWAYERFAGPPDDWTAAGVTARLPLSEGEGDNLRRQLSEDRDFQKLRGGEFVLWLRALEIARLRVGAQSCEVELRAPSGRDWLRGKLEKGLGRPVVLPAVHLRRVSAAVVPAESDSDVLDQPVADLANQTPRQAADHELGRHRLRRWLAALQAAGEDTSALRRALGM